MARLKAPVTHYIWHQQQFRDHAGNEAIRVCCASEDIDPFICPKTQEAPPYYFQVYSTVPFQYGHEAVAAWLDFSVLRSPFGLLIFDFYVPIADPFACVAHSRREINYRISKWRSTGDPLAPWSSDLIPKAPRSRDDRRLEGFLTIFTSIPPRSHHDETAGPPLLVTFDRRHRESSHDGIDRPLVDTSSSSNSEEDMVGPEGLDMRFLRQQNISTIDVDFWLLYRRSRVPSDQGHDSVFDYGLADDHRNAAEPASSILENTSETWLGHSISSSIFKAQNTEGDSIVIRSSEEAEPLMRYRIYVPFLRRENPQSTLEALAQAVTASITSGSGVSSFEIEYIVPPEATLLSVLSVDRVRTATEPAGKLGALVALQGQHVRVCPWYEEDRLIYSEVVRPSFAVVLQEPDWHTAGGILFLISDMKEQHSTQNYIEIETRRPVSMIAAAKRLAMPVLSPGHDCT